MSAATTFTVHLAESADVYMIDDPDGVEGDLVEVSETRAVIRDSDGDEVDAFGGPVSEEWDEVAWDTALHNAGYRRLGAWDTVHGTPVVAL